MSEIPSSDVFNFLAVRNPTLIDEDVVPIVYVPYPATLSTAARATATAAAAADKGGPLYLTLLKLVGTDDSRDKMVQAVGDFRDKHKTHIPDLGSLYETFKGFRKITEYLRDSADVVLPAKIKTDIEAILGTTIEDYFADKSFRGNQLMAWDNLFSYAIVPDNIELREHIIKVAKILHLFTRVVDRDPVLQTNSGIVKAAKATVILPKPIFPLTKVENTVLPPDDTPGEEEDMDAILQEIAAIELAEAEVRKVHSEQLNKDRSKKYDRGRYDEAVSQDPKMAERFDLTPDDEACDPFVLNEDFTARLSDETRSVLGSLDLELDNLYVPAVYDKMNNRTGGLYSRTIRKGLGTIMVYIGNQLISLDILCDKLTGPAAALDPCLLYNGVTLPKGAGNVQPLGVGDLIVLRQQLLKYDFGEIAHIENIMASEGRLREHRRLHRTEETFTLETARLTENERDTQTTERFGLEKETSKVIESQQNFEAGVTLSASYGPVSLTANANYSTSSSQQNSTETAVSYAKEVTSRAVERIVESVRQTQSSTTIDEVEELNNHNFDNTAGTEHIVGMYHWVDKYYQSQLYNYGGRLMFEFVIPEPAAFFIYSKANNGAEGPDGSVIIRPVAPDSSSWPSPLTSFDNITESNYAAWAAAYGAQDVGSPPPLYEVIATAFHDDIGGPLWSTGSNKELTVPAGYLAKVAYARVGSDWGGFIMFYVGQKQLGGSAGGFYSSTLNDETGIIPIAWFANNSQLSHIIVEVKCERSAATYDQWRNDTYNSIIQAYRVQLSAYEEKIAVASIQAGVGISGENPGRNREIEREELKKGCLELFTAQRFDAFDAMQNQQGPNGYPEFDFLEAEFEGDYLQFFEQAFEWHNMTYLFYPYFWGRKPFWTQVRQYEDTDPLFSKFLQAGAGKVLVPVRPAYQNAILHYLSSGGEIWNGEEAPTIDDPLYLSIITELQELQGNDEGDPIGDPWIVKIPTSLVMLNPDTDPMLPDNSGTDGLIDE
jgi:hypothetical protein